MTVSGLILSSNNLLLNVNPKLSFLDVSGGYNYYTQIILAQGIGAVHNHINNVILTPIGSDIFEPQFGCNIELELFSNPTDVSGWRIANSIITAIRRWLTYMDIGQVSVYPDYDVGAYEVDMPYTIPIANLVGRYQASLGSASGSYPASDAV